MLKIGDAANFRRTLAGLALIVAPLLDFAAAYLYPRFTGDPAADLTVIAGDPNRFLLASMLHILASILFVPAILGMIHLLRGRGVVLAHIGGGLALMGFLSRMAFTSFGLVQLPLATYGNRSEMLALYEHAGSSPVFPIFLIPFLLGVYVGLILLAIAVWRGGLAPWWIALGFVLAIVMDQVGPAGIGTFLSTGLLTVSFGYIGLKLLRMTDAEWQRPALAQEPPQLQPAVI